MDNNLIVSIRLNIWLFYFITYLPDNQSQIGFNSNIFLDRANHLKPYSGIMITTTMSTSPSEEHNGYYAAVLFYYKVVNTGYTHILHL